MEPYITSITLKALMIVCDWGGTFPTWKCWALCTVRIHVTCDNKQEQGTGYTEKYLQDSFLTMPFVHTTHLGNRTYQVCCSKNHFQQNDQNVLFTFYKNRKWLSQRANLTDQLTCEKILGNDDIGLLGYYLWLDKLTRRSGTILIKSHQDINGRKLRKSQERDESVLHLAHAQPNRSSLEHTVNFLNIRTP